LEHAGILDENSVNIDALANWLQEAGLVGPAYLLFAGLRPLSFVGSQGLLLLQPLLPQARWRSRAGALAEVLQDRTQFDMLLAALDARLRGEQGGAQGKENA
jgi:hypothetical protein